MINPGDYVFIKSECQHVKVLATPIIEGIKHYATPTGIDYQHCNTFPESNAEYSIMNIEIGARVVWNRKNFIVTAYENINNKLVLAQVGSKDGEQDIRKGIRHAVSPTKVKVVATKQLSMAIVDEQGHIVERLGKYER